jgi:anti-sigma factor RsiW
MTTPSDEDEVVWLLPDYVTGRLDPAGVAQVEAWIAADPVARGERVAFERAIAESVARRVHELPAGIGLERLLAAVAAEADGAVGAARVARDPPAAGAAAPGPLARLRRWLGGPQLGWALGAVVLVQSGLIGVLMQSAGPPAVEYRSAAPGTAGAPRPSVRVAFVPTATEAQVRELLLKSGATLIAGPTQLGEYWLAPLSGDDPRALLEALRGASQIQSASFDPVGPTRER